MNREIKFRAWDKKTKKMIFTGFHVMGEVTCFGLIDQYISENRCGADTSLDRWNDIELMQYTGLKDKSGKEIYEGDIVRADDVWGRRKTYEIFWHPNLSGWGTKNYYIDDSLPAEFIRRGYVCQGVIIYQNFEVIGNIYQNPELLEGENE